MSHVDITSNVIMPRQSSFRSDCRGSNFGGKIKELVNLAVDDFTRDNWNATIYFLSHCHTDHMRGLNDYPFRQELVNRDGVYLYAEQHTIAILQNKYPDIKSKLRSLDIKSDNILTYPDGEVLCVRLIPAGHCIGSVMFLFETDKRILYTGDLRIRVNELKKAVALHDTAGNLKKIDIIYLDTTFFNKSYEHFPTREESIQAFCDLIRPWIKQSKKHIVNYITPANYGSEYVFAETSKEFNMPIHIHKQKFDVYRYFPEMNESVITLDPTKTQIHSCTSYNNMNLCQHFDTKFILPIKTCALRWKNTNVKNIVDTSNHCKFVCYSSHSSYTEIIDVLNYIKPDKITPCVIPIKKAEREEMIQLLQEVIEGYTTKKQEVAECQIKNWTSADTTIFSSEEDEHENDFDF